ncbi:hypothetical protein HWV62_30029 [Athelia sp. TMB]|nr:hypothetical protein HWV62_30029 [Athelia sp. TMB]
MDKLADENSAPGVGNTVHKRWHGLEINTVHTAPPFGKNKISYKCMYNPDWLTQNKPKLRPMPTPADFDLQKMMIEDDDIEAGDLVSLNGV